MMATSPHNARMMTGRVQPLRRMLMSSSTPAKTEISIISWMAGSAALMSV